MEIEISLADIKFNSIQFCFQIHRLELGKFSEQNATKIGLHIGKVLEVKKLNEVEGHLKS